MFPPPERWLRRRKGTRNDDPLRGTTAGGAAQPRGRGGAAPDLDPGRDRRVRDRSGRHRSRPAAAIGAVDRTGRDRSTAVTPITLDGKRYVVGGFPGADWVQNVRATGELRIARGRASERVRMVELSADEARPILRAFPTEVPTGVGFMKRSGLVTDGRPEEFEALAGRCAVFRFDPLGANGID